MGLIGSYNPVQLLLSLLAAIIVGLLILGLISLAAYAVIVAANRHRPRSE